MKKLIYKGKKTKTISFPLGGIGSGSVGLAGNGRLIDWEIFNKPNKGSVNGFSNFSIKAETETEVLDARVLQSDLLPPYTGEYNRMEYETFGLGATRESLGGLPHFKDSAFEGTYPIANFKLIDNTFPGKVNLTAFNPFIPINDEDSSIPAAFFEWEIKNPTKIMIKYTIAFSVSNYYRLGNSIIEYKKQGNNHVLKLHSNLTDTESLYYGDMTIATDMKDFAYQEYWYRGTWFDNLSVFWQDFSQFGSMKKRSYHLPEPTEDQIIKGAMIDTGTLTASAEIYPGEKKKIRFVFSWNFPNRSNYWNPEESMGKPKQWKNYYSYLFENSVTSAAYCLDNWEKLYRETKLFRDSLFSSTMPLYSIDAVSANLSTIKSPTVMRLDDGSFYGFEGTRSNKGNCEGTCSHVWNYAYVLPFLFPKLERTIRNLDYKYNLTESGEMDFRLQLPLGRKRSYFRGCVDGQLGSVIRSYRDWKISGDTEWLEVNWPAIKKSLEYAWSDENLDFWDRDKDGVLEGRQHHTLDMELFGPSSWLEGFYLAALKAASEMADFLGEHELAKEYIKLFEKGRKWSEENLFNGEYYVQKVDIKDKSILKRYLKAPGRVNSDVKGLYWNKEAKELKYQIGQGCSIDQVIAQWHADMCGLGEIYDGNRVDSSLRSIYKYNHKTSVRKFFNPCRLYSVNDEGGTVICEWPDDKEKPIIPIPYSQETMYGFEYQAASHMIGRGLIAEGNQIVKTLREKFDGEKRNPWNEFEAGSNYARSMASYALVIAYSGFKYNMLKGMIGFEPAIYDKGYFKTIWSLDCAWGTFVSDGIQFELNVFGGKIAISELQLPFDKSMKVERAIINNKPVGYEVTGKSINFSESVILEKAAKLKVICKKIPRDNINY